MKVILTLLGCLLISISNAGEWLKANSKLRAKAIEIAAKGHVTSVFSLGFTALFHKVTFCEDGYWLQSGGIWGRSNRHERLIHATTLRKRVTTETIRIMKVRYPWVSGNVANDDVQKID